MSAHDDHDAFGGLQRDLRMLSRRDVLGALTRVTAGLALAPLAGACGDANNVPALDAADEMCRRIPSETGGPFPGNGTNGPNVLAMAGVERSDIRTSIGAASGTAAGVAFTMTMTIVSASTCEPLAGAAVYIWHCTADGAYSMYEAPVETENYLRGVQVTDAAGTVTFTTVFPGCYVGRWPHIHFEVYASITDAAAGTGKLAVSQLALPEAACTEVYATAGYEASVTALANVTLAGDGVFADDGDQRQLATVTGTVDAALTGALTVGIAT
jgi:protocatechuate 3,4-dioxygenase beta subunit